MLALVASALALVILMLTAILFCLTIKKTLKWESMSTFTLIWLVKVLIWKRWGKAGIGWVSNIWNRYPIQYFSLDHLCHPIPVFEWCIPNDECFCCSDVTTSLSDGANFRPKVKQILFLRNMCSSLDSSACFFLGCQSKSYSELQQRMVIT